MKSPIMDEIPPLTGTVRTNWRPFEGASVPALRRWHLFRPVPFPSVDAISNRAAVMSFLVENATVDSAYAAIAAYVDDDDDDDGVDEDVDNTRQSV